MKKLLPLALLVSVSFALAEAPTCPYCETNEFVRELPPPTEDPVIPYKEGYICVGLGCLARCFDGTWYSSEEFGKKWEEQGRVPLLRGKGSTSFGTECPYCGSENLESTERVGICNDCLARWVDGIWYSKDEWLKIFDEDLHAIRIKRLKSYGWTDKRIARVLEGYIYIGDTKKIVLEAWGEPEDINRTTTRYGTSEQWVYGLGCYVYFENGVVTAIQD